MHLVGGRLVEPERGLHDADHLVDRIVAGAQLEHQCRRDIEVVHAAGVRFEHDEPVVDLGDVELFGLAGMVGHGCQMYRVPAMGSPATGLWYACEFDSSGYAVAGRRYLHALAVAGVAVAWQPLVNTMQGRIRAVDAPSGDGVIGALTDLPSSPGEATAHHGAALHPGHVGTASHRSRGSRVIGQTVWESDPSLSVVAELATVDEVWVPTRVERGGRPPQRRRADRARRAPCGRSRRAGGGPVDRPGRPLRVRLVATWDWRKRPDLLLHAYLRSFTAADPVTLVLKTNERVLSWWCRSPSNATCGGR